MYLIINYLLVNSKYYAKQASILERIQPSEGFCSWTEAF